jgi:glycosyltransferase involved in cell wall biosynthesis
MKILACHNYYQQPGGEDLSFEAEVGLLESRGHEVVRFIRDNDDIKWTNGWKAAAATLWNRQTYRDVRELIRREHPDVMHCTNIFPLISPAAYASAQAEGVPVVQTLGNYRMFCSNALLMRDNRICEDCLGKRLAWPAVVHACYRESRVASTVVVAMQAFHRARQTWDRDVDCYVALTEFSRRKYADNGLPATKIAVKPNFVFPDPGPGEGRGSYAIFVGRLSPEKGIDTLLSAWQLLKRPVPLKIVGDGPLADRVRAAAQQNPSIEWLGHCPVEQLLSLVGDATCLVMPSICYEGFPRTIAEAYSRGTPVIASRLGAMAEIIRDGRTGRLFTAGDPRQLAELLDALFSDSHALIGMRHPARSEYEDHYTADANYKMLIGIYRKVIGERGRQKNITPAKAPEELPLVGGSSVQSHTAQPKIAARSTNGS